MDRECICVLVVFAPWMIEGFGTKLKTHSAIVVWQNGASRVPPKEPTRRRSYNTCHTRVHFGLRRIELPLRSLGHFGVICTTLIRPNTGESDANRCATLYDRTTAAYPCLDGLVRCANLSRLFWCAATSCNHVKSEASRAALSILAKYRTVNAGDCGTRRPAGDDHWRSEPPAHGRQVVGTRRPAYNQLLCLARNDQGTVSMGFPLPKLVSRGTVSRFCLDRPPASFSPHAKGLDLILDGSGSFDEDDVPESEFPIRCPEYCGVACATVVFQLVCLGCYSFEIVHGKGNARRCKQFH